MKQRKDIGEIYKDLYSEIELNPDNDLWDLVELKTEKIKFYRFGFKHFNIYYLSTIIVFSILSVYSFIKISSFTPYHPEKNITSNIVSPQSEPKVSGSADINDQDMAQPDKDIKNIISKSQDQSKIKKDNVVDSDKISNKNIKEDSSKNHSGKILVEESIPAIKSDSTKGVSKLKSSSVSPTAKAKVDKEPKKRIIYIEQPDTIIVVDTLKGKEARKKRNKLK